jgi:hypothetical protein
LDIASGAVTGQTIVPIALTTSTNGSPVDLVDSNANMASALLQVGAVSGTQGTLDVKIQESTATNTGWADIPNATFTQVTTSGTTTSGAVQIVSFQRQKRYVRAYATFAGTFTNMLAGVSIFAQRATQPAGNGGWQVEQGAS